MTFPIELPKFAHPDFSKVDIQPKGDVVIDWNNPLTKGLKQAYIFNHRSEIIRDYVRDNTISIGSADVTNVDRHGVSIRGVALDANSRIPLPNPSQFQDENWSGVSVLCRTKIQDGGQTSYFPSISNNILIASDDFKGAWNLTLERTASEYDFGWRGGDNTELAHAVTSRFVDNDLVTIGGTFNAASGSRRLRSYFDGVKVTNALTVTNGFTASATESALLHYFRSTERSYDGNLYYLFVWDHELTEHEMKAISDSPYQIFKPAIPLTAYFALEAVAPSGRIMGSIAGQGGLAGRGGIAGPGGGMAG